MDYNIEFAHIYADEQFSAEQLKAIDIAKGIISRLKKEGKTFCTTVLIDDYHPAFSSLDIEKLLSRIESNGVAVDFVGFEGKLVTQGNMLLKGIPDEKKRIESFHKKQVICLIENDKEIGLEDRFEFCNRHTCALLSATWSLVRLGKLDSSDIGLISRSDKSFIGEKIITILPDSFKSTEQKVIEIIKESDFKEAVPFISYEFFE